MRCSVIALRELQRDDVRPLLCSGAAQQLGGPELYEEERHASGLGASLCVSGMQVLVYRTLPILAELHDQDEFDRVAIWIAPAVGELGIKEQRIPRI